jgi:ectoine hydroxylase-related dioxygenase (phytanoyl-CoA dioxygenase family)
MEPLTDSTALLDAPDDLRARFLSDGYVFLRDVVARDDVLALRGEILDIVDDLGWLDDVASARPAGVAHHEGSEGFWPAYDGIQRLESFHRLAHDPALVDAVRRVIGADDVLPHPQKIARLSFPDPTFFTAPHQDYRYIQGTADFVTAWLPLGDYPPEHGGLRVLSRSWERGLLPVHRADGAGGLAVDADDDDPGWRTETFRPGDVVVFGSVTIHGAIPNLADALRLSVDYRYQAATEALAEPSLGPHFSSFGGPIPGWDVLADGWSSRQWFDVPDDLELTRMRRPASDDLVFPPSSWW